MHAYMIVAQPSRRQKFLRAARHFAVRLCITIGLLLLAATVVILRSARVFINIAATLAARAEYAASELAGTPPIGATVGARLAAEFTDEFRRTYQAAA